MWFATVAWEYAGKGLYCLDELSLDVLPCLREVVEEWHDRLWAAE